MWRHQTLWQRYLQTALLARRVSRTWQKLINPLLLFFRIPGERWMCLHKHTTYMSCKGELSWPHLASLSIEDWQWQLSVHSQSTRTLNEKGVPLVDAINTHSRNLYCRLSQAQQSQEVDLPLETTGQATIPPLGQGCSWPLCLLTAVWAMTAFN